MPNAFPAQFGPLAIALQLGLGLMIAFLAHQRGRRPLVWFIIGVFFGIFSLPVLLLLPDMNRERMLRRLNWFESHFDWDKDAPATASPETEEETVEVSTEPSPPPVVKVEPSAPVLTSLAPHGWYLTVAGGPPEGPLLLSEIRARLVVLAEQAVLVWHPDFDDWLPAQQSSLAI